MKYILALGIGFKKYRRNLNIRISSRKYFIDDLLIDENIPLEDKWPWHKDVGETENRNIKYNIFDQIQGKHPVNRVPAKLFFYELDDSALNEYITIDVDCKDNNYTNGFMSKTSLMCVRTVHLIPKNVLCTLMKNGTHHTIKRIEMASRFPRPEEVTHGSWPCQRKSWQFEIDQKEAVISPETHDFINNEFLHPDDTQIWMGGKFSVKIPIIKKFGFKMINPYVQKQKQYGSIRTNFFQWKPHFRKYYDINIANED